MYTRRCTNCVAVEASPLPSLLLENHLVVYVELLAPAVFDRHHFSVVDPSDELRDVPHLNPGIIAPRIQQLIRKRQTANRVRMRPEVLHLFPL